MLIILAAENLVIRRAIEDKPELYLDELQAWLEYQTGEVFAMQTLSRTVRQMGLTVKKVLKERDQQSNFCSTL